MDVETSILFLDGFIEKGEVLFLQDQLDYTPFLKYFGPTSDGNAIRERCLELPYYYDMIGQQIFRVSS